LKKTQKKEEDNLGKKRKKHVKPKKKEKKKQKKTYGESYSTFLMRFKILVNTHNLPKNSFIIYISFIIQKKSKLKKNQDTRI
jgi:hypothetical protein